MPKIRADLGKLWVDLPMRANQEGSAKSGFRKQSVGSCRKRRFARVPACYACLMQGLAGGNDSGQRKRSPNRKAFLLGIVGGIVLTLLCAAGWLAYFVWSHHMFIIGITGRGAALLSVLFGGICVGAVVLLRAVRQSED